MLMRRVPWWEDIMSVIASIIKDKGLLSVRDLILTYPKESRHHWNNGTQFISSCDMTNNNNRCKSSENKYNVSYVT